MTPTEEKFWEIAETLPEAKKSKMFGADCIKAPNGKAVALYSKKHDTFVVKLTGAVLDEALNLPGVELFNPGGKRPMGGWAEMTYDYSDKWMGFAEAGMEYVKTLR